ncbi:hypothetical protein ACVW17_003448 [Bradyrhizobium sp. USDA 4473]
MSVSKSPAHRRRSERERIPPFRAHPGDLAPRDAQDLIAYPFFSRVKTNRIVPIDFCAGAIVIHVEAMRKHGMAAISDADIPVWAVRQIVEARDAGLRMSRLMAATRYEISTFVARDTSAREYDRLKTGLDRPRSVTVQTSLRQPTEWRPYRRSWINEWKETVNVNERRFGLELILPAWLHTGVVDDGLVLTIGRTPFQSDRRTCPSALLALGQARWAPTCCRGPKLSFIACFSALYDRAHFTHLQTPTSNRGSLYFEQVGHAWSDATCTCIPTRDAFLRCNSFLERTDNTARSPTSASPYYTRCVPLRQLASRGELGDIRGWHQGHHMRESGEWAVRLTSAMLDSLKAACRYVADLEPGRAQRVADRVHHIQQLDEQRRPPDPQRLQRLRALRPDVDCAEPAGPHHLRNIFDVVPARRVHRRLGMARLDANHGEALLHERREQPCAVRERFQVDALEADSSVWQDQLDCVRGGLKRRPQDELAVTIHQANVRRLQRHVRTWMEVHRSLSPSVAGARRALRSRIIARYRRRNAAGEGTQVGTPIAQKCSGRGDWQRRGASPANLQKRHACLTPLKAYGSQFERRGAAA